jgi:hypothetical protein
LQEVFDNLAPNQYYTVVEGQGVSAVHTPTSRQPVLRMFPPAPNPFNDSTVIVWEADKRSEVFLEITDVKGMRIRSEKIAAAAPGKQQWRWDGRDNGGVRAPAGVYWVTLHAEGRRVARQLVKG